jgi:hypothetical protein
MLCFCSKVHIVEVTNSSAQTVSKKVWTESMNQAIHYVEYKQSAEAKVQDT